MGEYLEGYIPRATRCLRTSTAITTLRSRAVDTPRDRRVHARAKRDTIAAIRRTVAPHRFLLETVQGPRAELRDARPGNASHCGSIQALETLPRR